MRRALGLNSLSGQLTFWTALTVGVLVTALVFFAYRSARQDLIEQTRQTALAEVSLHALGIDSMVGRVASLVTTMAVAQGLRGPEPSPDVLQELRRILEAFPPEEACRLASRFEVHHTRKHGSGLNIAEIEISALTRACLKRRIPWKEAFPAEINAFLARKNVHPSPTRWRFSGEDARIKFATLSPQLSS